MQDAERVQAEEEHAPRTERMSRVDTAWLRMDNDVNLMMIVGVWLLTPALSMAALRERIESKLLKYDRFRQKAVADAMGAQWVTDSAFDIAQHVVPAKLHAKPGESQRHALQHLCGDLAMTPLDREHPLWQFHLIEDYEGGSAMIARVHHCIGDGIALISEMMSTASESQSLSSASSGFFSRLGGSAPPSVMLIITLMSAMPSPMQWWMRATSALPPS